MERMKQTLYQKQTQNLLLKPKMLQSLEMLAMPLMQLETHLKQEMVTNPMLELQEFKEDEESENEQITENISETLKEESDPELKKTLEETKELSEILDSFYDSYNENTSGIQVSEGVNFDQILRTKEDKKVEFIDQLDEIKLNKMEYEFAYELIDSIDDHGFLPKDYNVEKLAKEYGITAKKVKEIHQEILHFEPRGITARNIQECLLAQLDDSIQNEILTQLIKENFDDIIHKRYKKIAAKFGITMIMVLSLKQKISRLDPKPGLRLQNNQTNYVIPDVIIKKIDGKYEIIINDFSFPKIRMSRRYKEILKQVRKDKVAVEYVRDKINSAKFLIKSIYLRGRTLERVTQAIINNQMGFFYEDTGFLDPLTYSTIAEELQVNESTISRVVKSKYADTPFGIMCLKDFFTSKAGKDIHYNSVSRHNIEIQIKKMIDAEDIRNPLSDQDIANKLKEDGINVSRRVIAKYRKSKGILNSHLRRVE
ncbi:MAG: RNA polymerase factor sigma-54 [Candidatus Cloacimonetes bacterium]|nr:RNA polymerase factor sigma-54 [Candidatus Cloacimonadota bacterium]